MLDFIWALIWHISKEYEFRGIHKRIRELKNEKELTPTEWKQLTLKRLRHLLIFAQRHVPYYKRIFKQVNFNPEVAVLPDELERIPILTKDIIRKHLNEIIANNVVKSRLLKNATGGSTGVPLTFYQDLQYKTIAAAIDAYVREWWGIKPYDATALVWGADQDFHELTWKEKFYEWRHRIKALNAFRMSEEKLLEFCKMLKRWKPPYLMGYSSALEALAKCVRKYNIQGLSFKAIRSSAEMLWPYQRQLIEETFNSPVYNFYGSREINNLAAECPEEKRLHLISAWRYIEIVTRNGQRVPDGQIGYIAVTDLSNYAMPFIRYLNEDIAKMGNHLCPCGRPSPVLEELLGRSTDLIRTPRGEIIHGEFFTHLFYDSKDIKQFQIYQKQLNELIVRYVPTGKQHNESINKIVRKIRAHLGGEISIKVEKCQNIPIPPSGKHRFTISDIPF